MGWHTLTCPRDICAWISRDVRASCLEHVPEIRGQSTVISTTLSSARDASLRSRDTSVATEECVSRASYGSDLIRSEAMIYGSGRRKRTITTATTLVGHRVCGVITVIRVCCRRQLLKTTVRFNSNSDRTRRHTMLVSLLTR